MSRREMVAVPSVNDLDDVPVWAKAVAHNAACLAVAPDAEDKAHDVAAMVFSADIMFAMAVIGALHGSGMMVCNARDAMRTVTETMMSGALHAKGTIGGQS